MACLVDTGILLRAFDRDASEHADILRAIRTLLDRREELVVTVQNLAEFWNVSTRPKQKNGYELPIETVARRLRIIERFCTVLSESLSSFEEWKRLVIGHRVLGVKVHDARLASVIIAAKVSQILTLNPRDFERYSEISVITPSNI
jgi:predicted nucleic acid-binding protein